MSETTILQMLETGQNDLSWFNSNLVSLLSKYNNMFIAFHNKQVIDADSNFETLMKKLESKGQNTSNLFIKFVSKIKTIM
jgi:hypothetical protein